MRTIAATAVVFALLCTGSAAGQTLPIRSPEDVSADARPHHHSTSYAAATEQLRRAARQVGTIQRLAWRCQDTLGVTRTAASTDVWSMPPSLGYRMWAAQKWIKVAKACQATLHQRTIPTTNDWRTAVALAQRVYPGTADWLLYISRREGGHGGFVMNHQGSGAGGWMQFMASTYYAHDQDAYADVARRGFIVDQSTNAWTHPLGQAIVAGYMRFTHQDGCHWCL